MNELKAQSFRSHASIDPAFLFVGFPLLIISLGLAIYFFVRNISSHTVLSIWILLLSLAIFIPFFKMRMYAIKVQDRVIRLEERLRLAALLPSTLQHRISELTEDQLIGLRFASDAELPALAELALDKHLDRKQIKERIQIWRPDYWRV